MEKRIYVDLSDEKDGVTGTCQLFDTFFPRSVLATKGFTRNIPFIVDCGSFQGLANENHLNDTFNFDITKPEFGILTHGHLDHYGKYPFAINQGFYAPIFTTYVTKTFLSQVFLEDCLKIEKRHAKSLDVPSRYNEEDIEKMERLMVGCAYNKRIQYNENICIYFFDNGHVPGAAITLVQLTFPECEEINFVITGDYNDCNMFYKVNPLPEWVHQLKNVVIIMESTYGGTYSYDLRPDCFIDNTVKSLLQGMTCINPTFAFGRMQEVLYKLKQAQDELILPKKYPIYVDGKTGIGCTNLFLERAFKMYPHAQDFLPENLEFVESKDHRKFLMSDPRPKIFAASSGSGSYGASSSYISGYRHNPNAMVHATGHIFPDSKLGRMRNDDTVAAQFFDTDEFSAHAKMEKLLDFPEPFENVLCIFVTHGETTSREALIDGLSERYDTKVFNLTSDTTFRITSDGVVATFPRKTNEDNSIR